MANHSDENLSADFLNSQLGIPYQYLRQVLTKLSKNGLIKSTRGRSGGFELARDVSTIYIADIIEITEGLEGFNKCVLGFQTCPFDNKCAIHDLWDDSRNNIIKILRETSLANLIIKQK
jgi:Rrf2 family protein